MPPKKLVGSLKTCVTGCAGNLACVTTCENDFLAAPGNSVKSVAGGKVFQDSNGGKVFVNSNGTIGALPPGE